MAKDIFERKEVKYILNKDQYSTLLNYIDPIMKVDQYGKTEILNIYYDTSDFTLIKRSLDHPLYKEKLRLRCYGIPQENSPSFIEIKKKYKGIVYKRRIEMPYKEAVYCLRSGEIPDEFTSGYNTSTRENQIRKEIDYFLHFYPGIHPAMAIAYDRIAMYGIEDENDRITFDTNLRWSTTEMDLSKDNHGTQILGPDEILMEIKISGAMDKRISHCLSELGIFPVSFSKYGRAFCSYMAAG